MVRAQMHSDSQGPGPYNIALGFGSWQDPSNGSGLDPNTFTGCTLAADPVCELNPALSHFFMGVDGDAMLNKRFGFAGEFVFTPTRSNYGPLQYRQEFYDANALFEPLAKKRVTVRIEGGAGGAHTGFSLTESSCVGTAVCTNQAESFGGSNHFQEHASVGVQIYLTHTIFIRPQFDYRHVGNFTDQFSRDTVLQGGIWLGYNFGTF
jgi:hypothetical protein